MRLGIYGGSFDPVHYAHLLLAETARAKMRLDRVVFVPLGIPPHVKRLHTSRRDRYEMLIGAVSPYPEFDVSRHEIDSDQISYTVDSLRYYRSLFPSDKLFLIVSSETFNDMPFWKDPGEICELASLVTALRYGYDPPNFETFLNFTTKQKVEEFKKQMVEMPFVEISSTCIRRRVSTGESVRFLTPDSVIEYIKVHGLYLND